MKERISMLVTKPYIRENAVTYARKYAFSQNPLFSSFAGIGGNCTNFVSQAIYAGSCEMNYTPTFGWYYISLNERSPSWTGVDYFFNFITENQGVGPFGYGNQEELLRFRQRNRSRSSGGFYIFPCRQDVASIGRRAFPLSNIACS